jgi:2-phosphoglycerate kinase
MKTIVIGGVCRAGKSRLANMLFRNTKSTVLHADVLTNFVKNNLSEQFRVDIQLNGVLQPDPSEILVKKLIRHMGKEFDYLKIIESSVISPTTVNQHFRDDRYISLFLGYPRVDITQKLAEIRQAAIDNPHCWSHQYGDRDMLRYIKHFKQLSVEIQNQCQQFNIPFVDTSENWSEAIQAAYNLIMSQDEAIAYHS